MKPGDVTKRGACPLAYMQDPANGQMCIPDPKVPNVRPVIDKVGNCCPSQFELHGSDGQYCRATVPANEVRETRSNPLHIPCDPGWTAECDGSYCKL
jgi:hypothetical protein